MAGGAAAWLRGGPESRSWSYVPIGSRPGFGMLKTCKQVTQRM